MIVDPVQALGGPSLASAAKHHYSGVPTALPSILPSIHYETHTETGTRTLYAVFVIMVISTLAFVGMSWKVPASKRVYHVITALITTIAAISYFGMATGQGKNLKYTKVTHHNNHTPNTHDDIYREVFWARYVDWSLTTPLLLLDLGLLAGMNGADLLTAIVADLIMVLTGLFAAYGDESTPQKWGWYTIACIAYLVIVYQVAVSGRANAGKKGGKVGGFFASLAGYTFLLWTAYPVVWGIADGARKVDVDGEIIAYAVLDVLAKPVFGLWLLLTHVNMPETNVELGGFWANGLNNEGRIRVGDDEEGA